MSKQDCPIEKIVKRDGSTAPYDSDRITTAIFKAASSVGETDRSLAEAVTRDVEKMLVETYYPHSVPTVEDIQDVVETALLNHDLHRIARAYIVYRHDRAREREQRSRNVEATDNVPYKKIYEVLRWNMEHGCDTIEGLNQIIENGNLPELVHACDKRYEDEVAAAGDLIVERLPDVRIVIVAGPSSSGKTTTTIKVSEKLAEENRRFKSLAVDNYFFDLEMHPVDEFGDYDYETPQALDLALINEHLEQLLAGRSIKTPDYDFKTGKRTLNVHEMSLDDDEILLIDSLHGLYDEMTSGIDARNKFRLYIETLGQVRNEHGAFMRWSDNRLMRRMIRDSWHRNLQPAQTLTHWHYVRRSELQHIIPFIDSVDTIVNSALPYETSILKHKLFDYFPEAMEQYRDHPKRQDAYIRAKRVYEFLKPLAPIEDDSVVPPTSLLREFIGGSRYEY